jgi:serine/threonine protein kinase
MDSFAAEVSALSLLAHPNVIQFFNFFRSDSFLYIVLEHCPGGSIRDLIVRRGPIPESQLRRFAAEIVTALHFCHLHNIAHRDIKPSNILIDKYGRAKLADFGLAMLIVKRELVNSHVGSLAYIAPELARGEPSDPMCTDIWSLGVTFYEMATGVLPWESVEAIFERRFVIPGNVPPDFAAAIERMLVVDPTKRSTIRELVKIEVFQELPRHSFVGGQAMKSGARGVTVMPSRSSPKCTIMRRRGRMRGASSTFALTPSILAD